MEDEFPSAVARPKYDPDGYYCSSQDKRGHWEKTQVKFPPEVWAQICNEASSSSTPFRHPHDYIRNAIIHQLNRDAQDPDRDPAFVQHIAELTNKASLDTRMVMLDTRRQLIDSARKLAEIAAQCPPSEKDQLIAQIRLSAVGVSDEAKAELLNLARRYEK